MEKLSSCIFLLITSLINLSLENKLHYLSGKNSQKSREFWIQKSVRTLYWHQAHIQKNWGSMPGLLLDSYNVNNPTWKRNTCKYYNPCFKSNLLSTILFNTGNFKYYRGIRLIQTAMENTIVSGIFYLLIASVCDLDRINILKPPHTLTCLLLSYIKYSLIYVMNGVAKWH